MARGNTGANGRIETRLPGDKPVAMSVYRLRFESGAYFAASKRKTFSPEVIVTFQIDDPKEHYHVPLILSPFGYTTYQGN